VQTKVIFLSRSAQQTALVIKLQETRTGFINKVDWNLIRYLEGLDACKVAPNLVAIANLIQVNEPATSPYSSVTMRNCCGVYSEAIAQAESIHLNITQHFGFHLTQILQHDFDVWKLKIFRQLADAVIKGLIPMFEVQLHIPPVFPQSQQADGHSRVMRSHIPLHRARFSPRSIELLPQFYRRCCRLL